MLPRPPKRLGVEFAGAAAPVDPNAAAGALAPVAGVAGLVPKAPVPKRPPPAAGMGAEEGTNPVAPVVAGVAVGAVPNKLGVGIAVVG